LLLLHSKLRCQHLQAKARASWHTRVFLIRYNGKKLIDTAPPDGSNNAELREMRADRIGKLGPLAIELNLTRCDIITLCYSGVLKAVHMDLSRRGHLWSLL
jgi:hypothetical protein